jgi:WD40 repeat protein
MVIADNLLPANLAMLPRAAEVTLPDEPTLATFAPDSSWVGVVTKDRGVHRVPTGNGVIRWTAALGQEARALATDGQTLAVARADGVVRLFAAETARAVRAIQAGQITALAWSPDRRLLTASADGKVCVWEAATGRLLADFAGHTGAVRCLAVSRDGMLAASGGDDRTVRIWALPR